eukprot:6965086-Prymnesium_polylepis.2
MIPRLQPCFYSSLCALLPEALEDGLGCNVGGHANLRFCGFGAYSEIECPQGMHPSNSDARGVPRNAKWLDRFNH